jgi:hypothetical protein
MGQKINIVMDQGSTFLTTFNVVDTNNDPIDLSTYTANSSMKQTYSSATKYVFTSVGYANGDIALSMPATTTATIPSGRYVYDIDITDGSQNVSRVIEGIVNVTPGVTKGVG